ncbi:sensor histidine kinase [Knoellia sp. CPCC 206435]|uniref:sensor histidine kinase n=1 Tax=Knoellia terrae TaxID=3404797 RepID=UPI003B434F09
MDAVALGRGPGNPAARGLLAPVARLERWLDAALVLLLVACTVRYVSRHGLHLEGWGVVAGAGLLGLLALVRPVSPAGWVPTARVAVLVVIWSALTLVAPSFAWVAVAVAFAVLRTLPFPYAACVVALMAVLVSAAWLRITDGFDPALVAGPVAMAGLTVAAFRTLDREAASRQRLLDELSAAQVDLAAAQRTAGALAERTRISREIHDSVGQGLSSINLFLQAAEQEWARHPDAARAHVRSASAAARDGLDEVRQVVADLAPVGLGVGAPEDLHAEVRRVVEEGAHGLRAEVRVHGPAVAVPAETAAAVVRTARGAVANAVEHSGAERVVVSLTYERDELRLDVRDDGRGFEPDRVSGRDGRGTGLDGIRRRADDLGGRTTVESTPGEGTTVSVAFPRAGVPS